MSTLRELNLAYRQQHTALINRMRNNKLVRGWKPVQARRLRAQIQPRGNVFTRLQSLEAKNLLAKHGLRST